MKKTCHELRFPWSLRAGSLQKINNSPFRLSNVTNFRLDLSPLRSDPFWSFFSSHPSVIFLWSNNLVFVSNDDEIIKRCNSEMLGMLTSSRKSQIIEQIITAKLKLLQITKSLVSKERFQFLELSIHLFVTSSPSQRDEENNL